MALCGISHINRAAMSVAGTDRIMDQFGLEPTRMGAIYSTFLLVYSLAMIPGGMFIDRYGPRRALMVVGFGSAIFGALTGLTGWWVTTGAGLMLVLPLVRGTMGLVSAPLHPACARAVASWFPFAQRSWANGLVTAAAIAGVALSYPGFGWLIRRFDWPAAFLVCSGLTLLLTWIWSYQSTDDPARHPSVNRAERVWIRSGATAGANLAPIGVGGPEDAAMGGPKMDSSRAEPARGWTALLADRSLLLLTFSYAAVGYFQYLFVYWMQFYLEKVLKVEATQSKYYASLLQVGLAVGMPLGGWVSGRLARSLGVRWGRASVSGGGMVLSATLLGLGVWARDPAWIVLWFALAHVAIGASEGPIWATAVDIGAEQGGTAAAICNTGGNLGGLLAPMLTPWISEKLGWPVGIGVGGLICLLGAVCWVWINPRRAPGPDFPLGLPGQPGP